MPPTQEEVPEQPLPDHASSEDATARRLAELKKLVPEAFSEGRLDFDRLRAAVGEDVFAPKEAYALHWPGKAEAREELRRRTTRTLAPDGGIRPETARHVFIEGENLEVLRALQKPYYGKAKLIYIDPPYNTGNDAFVYNDDFREGAAEYREAAGLADENGDLNRLAALRPNKRENGRFHSAWLSMMYPRLWLARNLLRDDGAVFISIDDNEAANLKLLCDEIFGEENFIGQITVKGNPRGRDYGGIARMHDYILVYSKSDRTVIHSLYDADKEFPFKDKSGGFETRELRNRNIAFHKDNRPNLFYPFYLDKNSSDTNGFHTISLEQKQGWEKVLPKESQGFQTVWRWGKEKSKAELNKNLVGKSMQNGGFQIVEKYREKSKMARSIWDDKEVNTEKGTLLVKELFENKKVHDFPKPLGLMTRVIEMGTSPTANDLVIDFFAGSGTTAHAVLAQNEADGGNRRFLLVQLPEPCGAGSQAAREGYDHIAQICRKRIEKVIENIEKERNGKLDLEAKPLPGFAAYRLAPSNFAEWRSPADEDELRAQLALFTETRKPGRPDDALFAELCLKFGLELQTPHKVEDGFYKTEAGVWFGFGPFSEEMKTALRESPPTKVVLLDACFKDAPAAALANLSAELSEAGVSFTLV